MVNSIYELVTWLTEHNLTKDIRITIEFPTIKDKYYAEDKLKREVETMQMTPMRYDEIIEIRLFGIPVEFTVVEFTVRD